MKPDQFRLAKYKESKRQTDRYVSQAQRVLKILKPLRPYTQNRVLQIVMNHICHERYGEEGPPPGVKPFREHLS